MIRLALASLIASTAFAAEHTVTVADEPLKVEHTLPAESPVAVVLVAQCGSAVGIYATMADGTLLAFDMSSGIPFNEQADWANKARRVVTVDVRCAILPGNIGPSDVRDL